MSEPAAESQREQRWRGPIAALLVLCAVPLVPPLRVVFPIEQALLLIAPAMAVCAILGWWTGGQPALAIGWGVLAIWTLSVADHSSAPQFDRLARGWALLLAACFGIVCVLAPARDFFTRALLAIGLALALALAVILAMGGTAREVMNLVTREFAARNQEFVSAYEAQLGQSGYLRQLTQENPAFANFAQEVPKQLQSLALNAASVFPSLLALESLAVLALAWSLFHRLSRTRIGEPLSAVGDFRFDDQFIWGLLLGVTLLVLPSLQGMHPFGWMLVVFFGGLYAARGLGVVVWALRPRHAWVTALVVVIVLALPAYALAFLLGLGVGDTWVDWRRRPQSAS